MLPILPTVEPLALASQWGLTLHSTHTQLVNTNRASYWPARLTFRRATWGGRVLKMEDVTNTLHPLPTTW